MAPSNAVHVRDYATVDTGYLNIHTQISTGVLTDNQPFLFFVKKQITPRKQTKVYPPDLAVFTLNLS